MTTIPPKPDVLSVVLDPATADVIAARLEERFAAYTFQLDHLREPYFEGQLVRARLSGDVPDAFPDMRREHFSISVHGWTWELCGETRDMAALGMLLRERGFGDAGLYLADHLRGTWEPQTPAVDLVQMALTVRQLWWTRHWNAAFTRLNARVVSGEITQAQLLEELRAVAKETKF